MAQRYDPDESTVSVDPRDTNTAYAVLILAFALLGFTAGFLAQ